jgi:hypothetical protein
VIHFSGPTFFRLRYSYLLLDDLEIGFLLPAWDNRKILLSEVNAMRGLDMHGTVYTNLKGMSDRCGQKVDTVDILLEIGNIKHLVGSTMKVFLPRPSRSSKR